MMHLNAPSDLFSWSSHLQRQQAQGFSSMQQVTQEMHCVVWHWLPRCASLQIYEDPASISALSNLHSFLQDPNPFPLTLAASDLSQNTIHSPVFRV